ncbi:hypothetical protein L1987_86137 [Smallanthus sonchifolius]|uniref:Uncharacterized protein n=1 Tax=Smallanthus sonchifolius TaxID=185202 RepID=A0ACB8XYH9_9ASTR|nr:hypothetical protein L1987_86137 [Smallanthus sonchifolius]
MKTFTLRSQFYIPTHFNPISPKTKITKTPPRTKLLNKPMFFDSERVKITPKTIKSNPTEKLFGAKESHPFCLSTKVEKFIGFDDNSRCLMVGAVTLGFMVLLMGSDDHQMALAFGPEGPLMEDFWDNMRRYGLYALTVSSGVLYAVFQPLYELLKNPISAILVLTILGGGFYIVSQVVSAMVGITDFSYELNY